MLGCRSLDSMPRRNPGVGMLGLGLDVATGCPSYCLLSQNLQRGEHEAPQ